jgi:16S rRNA (guanine966-N2)-methyltransferase
MARANAPGRGIRVIAGSMRGRKLTVPEGDLVRPTKDRVREAMFSALDARGAIVDALVLDLYAGSGALAIESLSRGADRAVVVEKDKAALEAIAHNLEHLGLKSRTRVARANVVTFLAGPPPPEAPFDLVFADPPYDTSDDAVEELLASLMMPGWLAPQALISVERPARAEIRPPEGLRACWERTFGDTLMFFFDPSDDQPN